MRPVPHSPRAARGIVPWTLALAACNQPAPAVTDVSDVTAAEDAAADPDVTADTALRDTGRDETATDARPDAGRDLQERIARACEGACAERQPTEAMGFCPLADDADCVAWCAQVSARTADTLLDALWTCVASDPLCFQSPLQCVLGLLFPTPEPATVKVLGAGFDVPDGTRVVAALTDEVVGHVLAEAKTREGSFIAEGVATASMNGSRSAYFAIDADQDGRCSEGDIRGVGHFGIWEWPRERIELPIWEIRVSPDSASDRVACDVFGDN